MNPYKDIQPRIQSIPQERIIRKMDEYMSRRDYASAERHLKYWLEEAKLGNDRRGELLIRNELVGHFRKTGNREEALKNGDARPGIVKKPCKTVREPWISSKSSVLRTASAAGRPM